MPCLLCSQSDRGRAAAQYFAKGHFQTHALQQAESYSITSSARTQGQATLQSSCDDQFELGDLLHR